MNKILIVDDNETMLFTLLEILTENGYLCTTVNNGAKAIEEVKKSYFSLVILDYKLPDFNGLQILSELKSIKPKIPVIMLTAYSEIKMAVEAVKKGAEDFITKPFDNQEMLITIQKVLNDKITKEELHLLRENINKSYVSKGIVIPGRIMQDVLNQAKLVAPTNMSVLLQGESGSGKEVIANIIHKMSDRNNGPFVAVDCGAIPDTLFESELFGYEKGAFTDAKSTKEGRFQSADKGTLFLDEILNLSDTNQVKLLRVLEERKMTRLGGNVPQEFDVRILSAANVNLSDAVNRKIFRSDLYYRLNEFQILIPPLRNRKEDIPELVKQFIEDANIELNRNIISINDDALIKLTEYSWPGNVRELRNLIRRAVLLSRDNVIKTINFPFESNEKNFEHVENTVKSFEHSAKNAEREIIVRALEQNGGNKTKTAKMLNMNLRTLYRKINMLKINNP